MSIPVAFEVVKKPHPFRDIKTRKAKRAAEFTKNELMRSMIATCVANAIKFRYVLTDSWFAAKENFEFILKKGKHFISALKDNRLVALTEKDKNEGRYVRISQLELADQQAVRGWMKGSGNCSCVALPPASMQSSTMKFCSSGGSLQTKTAAPVC